MNEELIQLRPGDPCPICGQPIKTDDPEALFVLSVLANLIDGAKQDAKDT